MLTIDDAPEIRDAENNGVGYYELPECPICHNKADTFFFVNGSKTDILGCENCVAWAESWDVEDGRD